MRQALLVLAVVLVLAGCGGGGKSAKSTTAVSTTVATTTTTSAGTTGPTVTTHGRFHYPQVLITNYMKSCVAGGGAKKTAYCACTLDKLSYNVSTKDFTEIGLSKTIPRRIKRLMTRAVAGCASKL